ncbi:MAG: B12-binding domain-containing radical SAM protein [Planctomycetota bacterium]
MPRTTSTAAGRSIPWSCTTTRSPACSGRSPCGCIGTRCTLLDFPSLDRFLEQITANHYDIVGISAIMPNVDKVRKMCALVREHLPRAAVVVGGHIANLPGLDERIDADYIVRGEGVRWMRRFLSEDESQPVRHPQVLSGFGARTAGVTLRARPGDVAAILIPSVGCPLGCNFCATSAMFGGKGKFVHFYETGDELFEVMCELEKALNVWSFFVMDENFLLYRKRALRLLDLMVEHDKSWALYVFSSANVLRSYTIEQLVGLGVSWVWVGLEGKDADFVKLRGTDTRELVRTLQAHGIRVLGSSIIGLEEHTPQNIDEVIDYAVSHDADFHQFMLYTPIPGTPLHEEFRARGTLLDAGECAAADVHGQLKFNFRHPHITDGQETELLLRAFRRDFEFNGPSISRLVRTTLQGWQRYKNHPDRRIRQRFAREARGLAVVHAGGLWAARRWFRRDPALSAKIARILKDAYREFGLTSRLAAPVVGRYLYLMIKHEDRRLRRGWTYEPPTLCETSWMAAVGAHA